MISPKLLEILRCPLNPGNTRLRLNNDCLECERCALRFLIKDGFPVLVVEEAVLPPGCESLSQLPCQKEEAENEKCENIDGG
ncbi:MAG: hypothetical protein HYR84_11300 [Planctomycetes bacterium]|nr:hypothetical protein [Planctomycetota bacterium]